MNWAPQHPCARDYFENLEDAEQAKLSGAFVVAVPEPPLLDSEI
jgi:hypothetical protein